MKRRPTRQLHPLVEKALRILIWLVELTMALALRVWDWLEPYRQKAQPYLIRFYRWQDKTEARLAVKYQRQIAWVQRRFFFKYVRRLQATPYYKRHERGMRLSAWGAALFPFVYFFLLLVTLPSVGMLEDPDFSLPTQIFDRHERLVGEIYVKKRKLITYEQVPPYLINALVAKEDSNFFHHWGISPGRMAKAFWVNLTHFRNVQGASTLTQQTAKQFFLSPEKSYTRKIREVMLAFKIELFFSKEEILELYLNKVNMGDVWGIEAASEYYFGKEVGKLTLGESAVLVGMLPAPNRYKPTRNPHLARRERDVVLERMVEEGYLTAEERDRVKAEPIVVVRDEDQSLDEATAYYKELIRRDIMERYGSKDLYEGGLRVYTAMDLESQKAAHRALYKGVHEIDKRIGYRVWSRTRRHLDETGEERADIRVPLGPKGELPLEELVDLNPPGMLGINQTVKGVVESVDGSTVTVYLGAAGRGKIQWAGQTDWRIACDPENLERKWPVYSPRDILARGDFLMVKVKGGNTEEGYDLDLHQNPLVNGALYSIDPRTGELLAMVGGIRFGRSGGASEFIRATQAERQPGSAFKPIVYAAAVDEGYTPATMMDDSPIAMIVFGGGKHNVKNYDGEFKGRMTLREALYQSRNVPAVKLVDEMGPDKVIEVARRMGITTNIPRENLIGLGTNSVKLNELTHAYGVLATNGKLAKPLFILRIEDSKGHVLEENHPQVEAVMNEATAFLVTDMLRDVIRMPGGTAANVIVGLNRPVAGKTGTTTSSTNAWFMGYVPQVVTGIYVGYDDPRISLGRGETGGHAAAPIWLEYMKVALENIPPDPFVQPPGVVSLKVNSAGEMIGDCDAGDDARFEFFKDNARPPEAAGGCGQTKYGGGRQGPKENASQGAEDSQL